MKKHKIDLKRGDVVRVCDPTNINYECEAEVVSFDINTGEYKIEFMSGDSKGDIKKYSAADLKRY